MEMQEHLKMLIYGLREEFQAFQRDRSEFQVLKEVLQKGVHSNADMDRDLKAQAADLVHKEDTAIEVQRKAAESLPPIRSPQPPDHSARKKLLSSPEPTYPPSSQGVDRRATSAVHVVDDAVNPPPDSADANRDRDNATSAEPPIMRDTSSRQGRRVPTVRPLTDHRQREREVAALVSTGNASPLAVPAKASIPQASTIRPRVAGKSPTPSLRVSNESVVPMTQHQVAYAQFVAEAKVREEAESSPVPPYRDLKPKQISKVYE